MQEFDPKTATEHRRRWPAAMVKEWDFTEIATPHMPEGMDYPAKHAEYRFDFHDGLRIIASRDRYRFGAYLHVSASFHPGSRLHEKVPKHKGVVEAVQWFCALVRERVQFVGGEQVYPSFMTPGRMVPHFFSPQLLVDVVFFAENEGSK